MSASHIFGTDDYGRDYLQEHFTVEGLSGCRILFHVYYGNHRNNYRGVFRIYRRKAGYDSDAVFPIFLALPSMLLMIVLNAILQPGLVTLIFVLSLFSWAQVARITRA